MGIIQFPIPIPMTVGSLPSLKFMVSTDNLATVTTAGYLNNTNLDSAAPVSSSDIIMTLYNYNAVSGASSFTIFTVTISAATGVITLHTWANPGDVILPVVSGDFANFSGTTGSIADAGFSPTDPTKTKVVMLNAAPTINHAAIFTNANGTIGDGGVLGTAAAKAASNNALSTLASTAGSGFTIGHVITAADTAGTIQDGGVLGTAAAKAASNNALSTVASTAGSGFTAGHIVTAADATGSIQDSGIVATSLQASANLKAARTADIGGAGAGPISVVVAGVTSASIFNANINTSSNTVAVAKITATATGFDILFTADPGASCIVDYQAFVAPQ